MVDVRATQAKYPSIRGRSCEISPLNRFYLNMSCFYSNVVWFVLGVETGLT